MDDKGINGAGLEQVAALFDSYFGMRSERGQVDKHKCHLVYKSPTGQPLLTLLLANYKVLRTDGSWETPGWTFGGIVGNDGQWAALCQIGGIGR